VDVFSLWLGSELPWHNEAWAVDDQYCVQPGCKCKETFFPSSRLHGMPAAARSIQIKIPPRSLQLPLPKRQAGRQPARREPCLGRLAGGASNASRHLEHSTGAPASSSCKPSTPGTTWREPERVCTPSQPIHGPLCRVKSGATNLVRAAADANTSNVACTNPGLDPSADEQKTEA